MIRYFVSYAHPYGFGNTDVSLEKPLRSGADVKVLRDLLSNAGVDRPTILFFQRFESAEDPAAKRE